MLRVMKRFKISKKYCFYLGVALALGIVLNLLYSTPVKTVNRLENRVLLETNQYRYSKGTVALRYDERIAVEARRHSVDMAEGVTPFGHADSYLRFEQIAKSGINWLAAAENVACVPRSGDPVAEALQFWTVMRGYDENLQGDFDLTGIGIAKNKATGDYYLTQIFIKSK